MLLAVLFIIALIILIVVIIIKEFKGIDLSDIFESPKKRAGRYGEAFATNAIKSVLREDDLLFTNVQISYDGKPAELDNVVINKYGVFIIEVKNYNGKLSGTEDDYEWQKFHTTYSGNTYIKSVKNPIKQVKRQVYILANFLDYYGTRVWVKGFAFLVNQNSPVNNEYILSDTNDIDRAIHTSGRNMLNKATVEAISKLLSD